jgi:hypothetical protein
VNTISSVLAVAASIIGVISVISGVFRQFRSQPAIAVSIYSDGGMPWRRQGLTDSCKSNSQHSDHKINVGVIPKEGLPVSKEKRSGNQGKICRVKTGIRGGREL